MNCEKNMHTNKYRALVLFCGLLSATLPTQAQTPSGPVTELRKQIEAPWKGKDWVTVEGLYGQIIATGQAKSSDYRGLAIAISNQGKKQEAMQLKLSTAARPDAETDDHNGVCWGYLEQNKPLDARPYCQKAVALKSSNQAAQVNLGHSWLLTGDKAQAMASYRKSLRLIRKEEELKQGPLADFDLFIKNGWAVADALAAKTWYEQGWITLQSLTALRDQLPQMARNGQESEAMRLSLKAMSDSASLLGDDATLTEIFARRHVISATELAKRQIKESPTAPAQQTIDSAFTTVGQHLPPDELWGYWDELANVHLELGQSDKAVALWKKGLAARKAKLGPDHPDTLEYKKSRQIVLAIGDKGDILGNANLTLSAFIKKTETGDVFSINELSEAYTSVFISSNLVGSRLTKVAPEKISTMLQGLDAIGEKKLKLTRTEIANIKTKAKDEAQQRWQSVIRSLD